MAEVAIYDTLNDLRNASPKSATGATVVSVRGRTSVDDEGYIPVVEHVRYIPSRCR